MNNVAFFSITDIERIAAFLLGETCTTVDSDFSLPSAICFDENALYEICAGLDVDMMFVVEAPSIRVATEQLLIKYAEKNQFEVFVGYLIGEYIDSKIMDLAEAGYDIYLIKSEVIKKINALWSVPGQEFLYTSQGVAKSTQTRFKEYNKLGAGGFSTVYRGEDGTAYKVLSQIEKSSQSSVHRFKREYEIMCAHNDSGFTIRVSDYEPQNLVYQMELATTSLEDYIEHNTLLEADKDAIIMRCVECMSYLHSHNIVHRDFHPGNILMNAQGVWVVTDFGLAKSLQEKYSRATTTTRAVGRAWFTDPVQYAALKDGSFSTDLYSLAKTIDFIFNGDMTQRPNKYTSIIHKATSPDPSVRYESIDEMRQDIQSIIERLEYKSESEIVAEIVEIYHRTKELNIMELTSRLRQNPDGQLIWELVINMGEAFSEPFVEMCKTDYDLSEITISRLYSYMVDTYFIPWKNYDIVAKWAASVLKIRKTADDAVSQTAAEIVEHVATSVGRYGIKELSNGLKNNQSINAHIRGMLTSHEGY